MTEYINSNSYSSFESNGMNGVHNGMKKKSKRKKILKIVLLLILAGIFLFLFKSKLYSLIVLRKNQPPKVIETPVENQVIELNKKFNFLGIDENGKKKEPITLTITKVEKTNQVLVQDKTYTAKNDKIFLIVNLELKNETAKRLNIYPGDLVRLVIDNDEEKKFAPDLHNNYVLVAPISTKVDRLGFVIDKNVQKLKLQVGEVEEKKEELELKF